MTIDQTMLSKKLSKLFEEEQVSQGDALLILCNLIGAIVSSMATGDEDRQEGAEFCATLIEAASQNQDPYDGFDISHTYH